MTYKPDLKFYGGNSRGHPDPAIKEIRERTARIETRVTKMLQHFNIDPGTEPAVFIAHEHALILPSKGVSLKHILDHISGHDAAVDIFIKDEYLCTLSVEPD